MKIRTLVPAAVAGFVLGSAAWMIPHASAQPMWDMVKVNLPYPVTVGNKTLSAGEYTIKQEESPNDSPILEIYNGNGMKFETAAMTIHALDPNTPQDTSVSLYHIGDDYYFDKIWIQGKNYGYEIPLPKNVKEREKESTAVSVPAQTNATSAAATPSPSTSPAADNTAAPPPQPPPAQEPAASTPPPAPSPQPQPSADQDTQPAPPTAPATDQNSANRGKRPDDTGETPKMPATSAGWLAMLLSGGTLSGVGMMLRRRK